jgi:hypothetical protein
MFGASLILLALIELLVNRRWQSAVLVAIIVGVAAGMHFQVSLSFRRDWLLQRDFFWQLAWRAPGLQPGTALLVTELPFTYTNAYALTAPLNWMYPHPGSSLQFDYLFSTPPYYGSE